MDRTRIGVIGVGWISQVVHLPILSRLPEAELVAICDKDRSKGRLVGEKFGIKKVYSDLDKMMENEEVTAVVVATPTDTHRDIAMAALRAGRDVLVEKPIGRSYAEAVEMAACAREHDRLLMVGMNHRFRPDTIVLKSFLQGKELGRILHLRSGWLRRQSSTSHWLTQKERSGGGVLLDLGIVVMDLAFWLLEYPEVKKVSAAHFALRTRGVEDTSIATITLKNGTVVSLEASWSMTVPDDVYYCQVYGAEGSASLNPLRVNKEMHGNLVNLAPARMEPAQHWYRRSFENELRHFLGSVRTRHPVISSAEEAVQRMRVVDAMYKSARTGKEVPLT
jgi:predicted dehydrogenase